MKHQIRLFFHSFKLPRNIRIGVPISKNWSRASTRHIEENAPTEGGVYELKTFGKLVYVGKASNLQRRLLTHLNERNPNYYRYKKAGFLQRPGSMEKEHLTAYGATDAEIPPWNDHDPRR
jgi:predicted GIY-YIG superfamily endonuclease